MSSNWATCLLEEIASSDRGAIAIGPFGSRLKADAYVASGVRVIRGTNLNDGSGFSGEFVCISEGKASELGNANVRPLDLVFPHRGNIGSVGLVPDDGKRYVLSTSLMKVTFDTEKVDPRFMYFFFRSDLGRQGLLKNASQVGTPGIATPLTSLKACVVPIPPLHIQRDIATTLDALDQRINVLRRHSSILEGMARAIFESWFINFDPVRSKAEGREPEGMSADVAALFPREFVDSELGPIPKGWCWRTMGEISSVGIGKTPPRKESQWFSESDEDVPWVSIRDMGALGAYVTNTREFLTRDAIDRFNVRSVPKNTVLLSFKLTVGRVGITVGQMVTNEAIAHFNLPDCSLVTSEYVYLYLKRFNFDSLASTSSIADAVNSKTVREIPVLVPDREVMGKFQEAVEPIFSKILLASEQSIALEKIRDLLLPRLLSGTIKVA